MPAQGSKRDPAGQEGCGEDMGSASGAEELTRLCTQGAAGVLVGRLVLEGSKRADRELGASGASTAAAASAGAAATGAAAAGAAAAGAAAAGAAGAAAAGAAAAGAAAAGAAAAGAAAAGAAAAGAAAAGAVGAAAVVGGWDAAAAGDSESISAHIHTGHTW
ncbi:unnamed protein product [Closterium sp. Naga37s-1]|nr:unnamed protein product [Closterium sp. Naga37s-1]